MYKEIKGKWDYFVMKLYVAWTFKMWELDEVVQSVVRDLRDYVKRQFEIKENVDDSTAVLLINYQIDE